MKVKLNDKVMVISGKAKGKSGHIIRMVTKDNKVVVEKLNMRIKHIKKTQNQAGQKITFEAPMSAANVVVVCPNCNKPARIGYKVLESGKKERICKKCKESVDRGAAVETGAKAKSPKKVKAL